MIFSISIEHLGNSWYVYRNLMSSKSYHMRFTLEVLGHIGVVIKMPFFDDQQSLIGSDAGYVRLGLLLLFLVTMSAIMNFSGSPRSALDIWISCLLQYYKIH